jgi:soluble lytic murein transglycosylase
MADARSSAGALGLMQLMPATAAQVAKELKLGKPGTAELITPATNIELGTSYLRSVFDRLEQNQSSPPPPTTPGPAGYAVGCPRAIAADQWVETIPFKETRQYVQRVMAYKVFYQYRLGEAPQRLAEVMPPIGRGGWGTAANTLASGDSHAGALVVIHKSVQYVCTAPTARFHTSLGQRPR